jgi:MarR family transcriptional regulator for hemolysin
MRDYDFEQSIGYWICISAHIYQRRLDRELAPLGITFRQFQVLAWLVHSGELSQAELAERMMIEPPTLVRLLDRMQSQQWIERTASPTDRRSKRVRPAANATPIWNRVVDCLNRLRCQATENMTSEEVDTLHRLLDRVQQNLTATSSPATCSTANSSTSNRDASAVSAHPATGTEHAEVLAKPSNPLQETNP